MSELLGGGWKFFVDYRVSADSFRLYLRRKNSHNLTFNCVSGFTFLEVEEGHETPAVAECDHAFLQAIMDGIWDSGIRPTGYADVRESLKHVNAHLQDMRALSFGKLGVAKP